MYSTNVYSDHVPLLDWQRVKNMMGLLPALMELSLVRKAGGKANKPGLCRFRGGAVRAASQSW